MLTRINSRFGNAVVFTIAAIAFAPSFAFAAEEAAGEGSWTGTLFYSINFLLFVGIIYYFAGPMVRMFFRDRSAAIRSQLDRLNSALREAQDLANRAAARMAQIEQEVAQLSSEIESETTFIVNRIREGARTAAERVRRDTDLTGAALIDAAQRRVRERLAATAANLARDLIAKTFEASDQSRLIDNFMDKIRNEAVQ
ncbi:MAG TPA: ATP synthase F0 subunit B [Candidatus Binataceae bacterium]|nr:ATP synthase F0 subunit B [Candidatus Binataceae bacterium]